MIAGEPLQRGRRPARELEDPLVIGLVAQDGSGHSGNVAGVDEADRGVAGGLREDAGTDGRPPTGG